MWSGTRNLFLLKMFSAFQAAVCGEDIPWNNWTGHVANSVGLCAAGNDAVRELEALASHF